jgi:hypothetical protein
MWAGAERGTIGPSLGWPLFGRSLLDAGRTSDRDGFEARVQMAALELPRQGA